MFALVLFKLYFVFSSICTSSIAILTQYVNFIYLRTCRLLCNVPFSISSIQTQHTRMDDFFDPTNYTQYLFECSCTKHKHFVLGNEDVSKCATVIAQIVFVFSVLMILGYGFIRSDEYPMRPLLVTLLLFPFFIIFVRVLLRPEQHPAPFPLLEIDISRFIMKKYENFKHAVDDTPGKRYYDSAKKYRDLVLTDFLVIEKDKKNFYSAMSCSTALNTVVLIIMYSYYTYANPGYEWNDDTKDLLVDNGVIDSETQWVIWAGPAIIIIAYALLSAMFYLRTYLHDTYEETSNELNALKRINLNDIGSAREALDR